MISDRPIRLETERAWRTYLGGRMISALHGQAGEDGHFPEEWLMSTVSARNAGREHIVEGLTRVSGSGLTLSQLLSAQPEAMLGKAHAEKYGANPGVLVKLLDAAERLTLQVHPTRSKAQELFGSPFGKTECWHILDCRTIDGVEPCVYIGFREGITRAHWEHCFHTQDIPAMLACLHRIPVAKGDSFIIRGGVPHGITRAASWWRSRSPRITPYAPSAPPPRGCRWPIPCATRAWALKGCLIASPMKARPWKRP